MSDEELELEVEVLLILLLLISYIFSSQLIEHNKIDFLHESGIAILLGIVGGIIFLFVGREPINFSGEGFFYFVLPPIIFGAGYTLKEKNFFKNVGYITLFGVLGTLISMVVLSTFVIIFNDIWFPLGSPQRLTLAEWLMLSSVLWATDTIAALAIVKEKEFPTLNSILFGEGVVNDAVSILIFQAVEKMVEAGHQKTVWDYSSDILPIECTYSEDIIISNGIIIGFDQIFDAVLDFFALTFNSLGIGIGIGLISAFIFKHVLEEH